MFRARFRFSDRQLIHESFRNVACVHSHLFENATSVFYASTNKIMRTMNLRFLYPLERIFYRLESLRLNYRLLRYTFAMSGLKDFFHCLVFLRSRNCVLAAILPHIAGYKLQATKKQFVFCCKMLLMGCVKWYLCSRVAKIFTRYFPLGDSQDFQTFTHYQHLDRKSKTMVVHSSDFFDNPLSII